MDALTKWSAPVATKVKRRLTFKQFALLALTCVAAVSGSGYGYYWGTTGRFIESTDDAYVGGNVTPISPHIAGFIAEILVTDNQRVDAEQEISGKRHDNEADSAASDDAARAHPAPVFDPAITISTFPAHDAFPIWPHAPSIITRNAR